MADSLAAILAPRPCFVNRPAAGRRFQPVCGALPVMEESILIRNAGSHHWEA